MTLEEFIVAEPDLGPALERYTHNHVVDGVYKDEASDRWIAHVLILPYYELELCLEARCHENCGRLAIEYADKHRFRRRWVWEGHACCPTCEHDPAHYYTTVHE